MIKMTDLFKEALPSIMHTKKEIFIDDLDKNEFYNKNSYIINKALSMHVDCVIPANLMNMFHGLDGKLKHDFYMNSLRGYKRKFSYAKSQKFDSLNIIKEYYGVNDHKAKEMRILLSDEQMTELTKRLNKGGVMRND